MNGQKWKYAPVCLQSSTETQLNSMSVSGAMSSQNSQTSNFVNSQSTGLVGYLGQNNDIPWGTESLEDLLEFPENVNVGNPQIEVQNGLIPAGNQGRGNDWQWAEQLMIDDNMDPNWSEMLADVDPPTLESKVWRYTSSLVNDGFTLWPLTTCFL